MALFFALFATAAEGQELYGLAKRSEYIPERGAVESYAWRTEQATFTFIPPAKWDMDVKPQERKISLRSIPFLSGLTARVVTNTPGIVPAWATAEVLRKQIIRKFPEALIKEEFLGYSPAGPGPVIDIEVPGNGSRTCHRVAWIPFKGGLIEIELISPEKYIVPCHGAWSVLLGSFRIETASSKNL